MVQLKRELSELMNEQYVQLALEFRTERETLKYALAALLVMTFALASAVIYLISKKK